MWLRGAVLVTRSPGFVQGEDALFLSSPSLGTSSEPVDAAWVLPCCDFFYSVQCPGSFSAECHRLGTLRGSPLMAVSLLRALCIIRRKEKGPFRTRYVSSSSRRFKIGQRVALEKMLMARCTRCLLRCMRQVARGIFSHPSQFGDAPNPLAKALDSHSFPESPSF